MKILFLDVDGVLNNGATCFSGGHWPIDPNCVRILHRIIEATGCQIVLSSSWRHTSQGRAKVRKAVKYIDITDGGTGVRGKQIRSWLQANPEVTKYAILDDDKDMLEEQLPSFFQTSFQKGLTEEIANQVIYHLNS